MSASGVWSGPVHPAAASFRCTVCGHRVQTEQMFEVCPACSADGFYLVHYGPIVEGPALPLTPPRIVRDPPICQIADDIDHLASTIFTRTGRHGITRISLTPDVGLAFGIAPGTSVDVQTSVGRVEVYAERTPRFEGVVQIDLTEGSER